MRSIRKCGIYSVTRMRTISAASMKESGIPPHINRLSPQQHTVIITSLGWVGVCACRDGRIVEGSQPKRGRTSLLVSNRRSLMPLFALIAPLTKLATPSSLRMYQGIRGG